MSNQIIKRNILTIFLASPNDLRKEREIVRDMVDRVNKNLSRYAGWHTELLGWEDTLPGASRPQELINKDVDSCQLFLGMLSRRWGTPSGSYSSGFEEEFIRAKERRAKYNEPEIWLFFKEIDEDSAQDPGDELKKILDFKDKLIDDKEIFFKEFPDTESWGNFIYDYLLQYVLKLSSEKSEIESKEESFLAGQAIELQSNIETEDKKDKIIYPADLVNLFDEINISLKKGDISDLHSSDLNRLYLQSSAWFSEDHIGETFGNHEINIAYVNRKQWELSDSERIFLIRSFIVDQENHRPAWYWLKEWTEENIDAMFKEIAINDLNIDVRRKSFSFLAKSGFIADRDFLNFGINDSDKQIVLDAIRLIRITENPDYLDLIQIATENPDKNIRNAALAVQIDIMYLDNPNNAFSYLIESGASVAPLINESLQKINIAVDMSLLFRSLKKANASVRVFSAQYLRKSNSLDREACYELLKDTNAKVRKEGLLELFKLGESFDMDYIKKLFPESKEKRHAIFGLLGEISAHEFTPYLLKKRDPKELLSQLSHSMLGYDAYNILVLDHFDLIKDRIRDDLDQEFEQLITASKVRSLDKYKPNLGQYVKDKYIAIAIDGLAKNGNPEDIKYARKYLGNTQHNMADDSAISMISKYGDSSDVENLIKVLGNNYGNSRKNILEFIFKMTDNKEALFEKLIDNEDNNVAGAVVNVFLNCEGSNQMKIASQLMKSSKDMLRVKGAAIVCENVDPAKLEEFLDDYTGRRSYYYNVVTWIDRYLYSKGKYSEYYKLELSKMLSNN